MPFDINALLNHPQFISGMSALSAAQAGTPLGDVLAQQQQMQLRQAAYQNELEELQWTRQRRQEALEREKKLRQAFTPQETLTAAVGPPTAAGELPMQKTTTTPWQQMSSTDQLSFLGQMMPAQLAAAELESRYRAPPQMQLEKVIGSDGKARFVPRAMAVGMEAWTQKPVSVDVKVGGQLRAAGEEARLGYTKGLQDRIFETSNNAGALASEATLGLDILRSINTGPWEPLKMEVSRWLGVNPEEVGNQEWFFATAGNQVMKRIQETKGAVSDKEMAYFKQLSPSLQKTKKGNFLIMWGMQQKAIRDGLKAQLFGEYLDMQAKAGKPGDTYTFNRWAEAKLDEVAPISMRDGDEAWVEFQNQGRSARPAATPQAKAAAERRLSGTGYTVEQGYGVGP